MKRVGGILGRDVLGMDNCVSAVNDFNSMATVLKP